jgi:hypothetical protein
MSGPGPDFRAAEARLLETVNQHIEADDSGGSVYNSNRASEIGIECDAYHALRWLRPDLWRPPDLGLRKIFRIGNALEKPNLRLIEDAGYKIVEQNRAYSWSAKRISAHIDAKILIPELGPEPVPLEHKTLSPNGFRAFKKIYDDEADWREILGMRYMIYRKYPAQLMAYEFLDGTPHGVWMFFEKTSGDFFFWLHELDFEYAETLIQRAERTNENVAAGRIPEPRRCEWCAGCVYEKSHCFLGKDFGPGYDVMLGADEIAEWEPKIARAQELAEPARERDDLMDEIKAFFKGRTAVVGSWFVESKSSIQKRKAQPEREIEMFRLKIEKL